MEKTYGEKLVRSGFNPSENPDVQEIKFLAAQLIDKTRALADQKRKPLPADEPSPDRWAAQAVTHFEMAAMYAVKVATVE